MLSDLNSGLLRQIFRVYFIITITLLGLIGRQCCKLSAKLDLVRGERVKLHRMTGWLQLRDVVLCLWKIRRLPGGWWLGLMMVVGSLLTLTADLAVARLVYSGYVTGYCDFDFGLVMDWSDSPGFTFPPANSYSGLIASNAQILSVENGCYPGIYKKVPNDVNKYICSGIDDIMGSWICEDLQQDLELDESSSVDTDFDTLLQDDLQYSNYSGIEITNGYGQSTHLVAWSSSVDDDTSAPFDVKVSVDLNGIITSTKTMKTFQCKIASNDPSYLAALNTGLSNMLSNSALNEWAPGLDAVLYQGADTNASQNLSPRIEQYLNTMTMVQGGNNYVFNETLQTDIPFFGCLVPKTSISGGVLCLVAFAALILAVTILYYITLVFRLGTHAVPSFMSRSTARGPQPIPDSVMSWMLQASRENAMGGQYAQSGFFLGAPEKEGDLKDWSFDVVDAGNGVARVVRTMGEVSPNSEQFHFTGGEK